MTPMGNGVSPAVQCIGSDAAGWPLMLYSPVYGVNNSSRRWSSTGSPDSLNHSTGCGGSASVGVSMASNPPRSVTTVRVVCSR